MGADREAFPSSKLNDPGAVALEDAVQELPPPQERTHREYDFEYHGQRNPVPPFRSALYITAAIGTAEGDH